MEFDLAVTVLFFCSLVGFVIGLSRKSDRYLIALPTYLLVSFIVEIIGWKLSSQGKSNVLLYSIFNVVTINFYLFLIADMVKMKQGKKGIWYTMIVFSVLAIANFLFYQGLDHYHSISYSIGSFCIVGACAYYFLELFKYPYAIKLIKEPPFWIVTGLLFFFAGGFGIFGAVNLMSYLPKIMIKNLGIFVDLLNILLYTMFIIGFLCRIKLKKSTRLS